MPYLSFPKPLTAAASAVAASSAQIGPDQGHFTGHGHVMSCRAQQRSLMTAPVSINLQLV